MQGYTNRQTKYEQTKARTPTASFAVRPSFPDTRKSQPRLLSRKPLTPRYMRGRAAGASENEAIVNAVGY